MTNLWHVKFPETFIFNFFLTFLWFHCFSSFSLTFLSEVNPSVKPEVLTPADRRKALYQKFYKQVQEGKKSADCVVLSVTNKCLWVLQTTASSVWPFIGFTCGFERFCSGILAPVFISSMSSFSLDSAVVMLLVANNFIFCVKAR